jgi:hypothetical protein
LDDAKRRQYLIGLIGVAGAVFALLFLPFAGFTEKTTYFNWYSIVGVGTYGDGLHFFDFPELLFYVQILLLVSAVALIGPLRLLWTTHQGGVEPSTEALQRSSRIIGTVAAGAIVLLLATMFVLLPSVEDRTIWLVNADGYLDGWWPGYGAFIAIGATAAGYLALRSIINSTESGHEPPA